MQERKPGQTKKLEKYRKLPKDLILYTKSGCPECTRVLDLIKKDRWVLGRVIVKNTEDLKQEELSELLDLIPKSIKSYPVIRYENDFYSKEKVNEVLELVGKDCYSNMMFEKCYSDGMKTKTCVCCEESVIDEKEEGWLRTGVCEVCRRSMIRKRMIIRKRTSIVDHE